MPNSPSTSIETQPATFAVRPVPTADRVSVTDLAQTLLVLAVASFTSVGITFGLPALQSVRGLATDAAALLKSRAGSSGNSDVVWVGLIG